MAERPRYPAHMANTATTDKMATADEVRAHAVVLRQLAASSDLGAPQLREDGTLIVHSPEPGYRIVLEFAALAASQVGTYVHVITDDAPAARVAKPL